MLGKSKHLYIWILGLISILLFITSSCQKDDIIGTDPSYKLSFSADTLIFDTVFTTIGSTTRTLKIYNSNDKQINVSRIRMAGGSSSPYDMNVNGISGTIIENLEIPSGDSIFIFVKVTVDPNLQNNPLIITDSIVFETNGNIQDVDLAAWGQDAHFFVGKNKLPGLSYPYIIVAEEGTNVTWEDDKPYVIYGWAVIDSAASLTIGRGVDIHFHQNSGLWVYRGGSIHVNGEKDSLVTFQGDRLENYYKNLPGQWDRIWINEGSTNNEFNYTVIKNGYIGLQAEITGGTDLGNALILNNTTIENMARWGLFSISYRIFSTNSVFANCAENTLFLAVGGQYDFRQCTFANYWNQSIRQDPSFTLSNNLIVHDADGNPITYLGNLNAYFGNCLIYGNVDEEIILSQDNAVDFNYQFDHCFLKTELDISDMNLYLECKRNIDPLFVDVYKNNYRLDTLSPASDYGSMEIINNSAINITTDLDGNSRISDEGPDLGAYEFIPGGGSK